MTNFSGLAIDSGLSDVLNLFPRNSKMLLRLLDDIMCADGELSRGEREAIAAFRSKQNATPYCEFYHTAFSEVFCGSVGETNKRISPLLDHADSLHSKDPDKIKQTFEAALEAGWSENAIYEVVEVCGIFDFINTIVLASGIAPPSGPLNPRPTADTLEHSYADMAKAIST